MAKQGWWEGSKEWRTPPHQLSTKWKTGHNVVGKAGDRQRRCQLIGERLSSCKPPNHNLQCTKASFIVLTFPRSPCIMMTIVYDCLNEACLGPQMYKTISLVSFYRSRGIFARISPSLIIGHLLAPQKTSCSLTEKYKKKAKEN